MKLIIGGVRGSQPVCGAAYTTYGGDTTSLLVAGDAGALRAAGRRDGRTYRQPGAHGGARLVD